MSNENEHKCKENKICMCTFDTSRLFHSEISNLLSLNLYISEASQKRPDGLQDEESVLQKKMKSSKSYVILHSNKPMAAQIRYSCRPF